MVKLLLIFILTLIYSSSYAVNLNIKLTKNNVEIGKYITAKIIYQGVKTPKLANLNAWQKQVFVNRGEVETIRLKNGILQTTEKLRIYPRYVGQLNLDAIATGGAFTKSTNITVTKTVRNGINLTPKITVTPQTVWQNQLIKVTVKINLLIKSNHIFVDEGGFEGFKVIRFSKQKKQSNNKHYAQLTWFLIAKKVKQNTLTLPEIEQRGKGKWAYYLPLQTVTTKPIPSYIPSTVPVGKIKLSSQLISQNNSNYWQLTVSNQGILAKEVYSLRKQLAKVSNTSISNVTITTLPITKQGTTTQLYQSPMPKWAMGYAPKLTLQYFDSQQGQIIKQNITLPRVWVLPAWAKLLILLGLMLVLWLNKQRAKQQLKKWQSQIVFYTKLKQNQTNDQRRQLINNYPYKNKKLKKQLKKLNKSSFSKPIK